MYVNLYPNKELKKTKNGLLWSGAFLLCGGLFLLLGEAVAHTDIRWGWAAASAVVSLLGASGVAVGTGRIHLKDAFFSMTPERISYRLTLYGQERTIYWDAIDCIQASEHTLVLELKDGKHTTLRLGHIQDKRIANHVSVSIQLAAIQQNVEVNQVVRHAQRVSI